MPDISMCHGVGCIQRETCYRFKATPSDNQWWADFDADMDKGIAGPRLNCRWYVHVVPHE